MKNIDYKEGMEQIASQLGMEKIISSPTVLPSAMADFWLPEKDIEIMQIAMKSSCAPMLLAQIRDMRGTHQDFQNQKTILMKESYLGEEPAHRVLVGLWAMVGKDVENGGQTSEQQTNHEEQREEQKQDLEMAVDECWGHGLLYCILMFFAELLFVLTGAGAIKWINYLSNLGVSAIEWYGDWDIVCMPVVAGISYIFAHALDRKDNWHLKRGQMTMYSINSVLPESVKKGMPSVAIKWICWIALAVLPALAVFRLPISIQLELIYDAFWDLYDNSAVIVGLIVSCIDLYFDVGLHKYLNEIGVTPESLSVSKN